MFVYCFENKTKEKLIKNGYKYISDKIIDGKVAYIFENNNKLTFFNNDKVFTTNKLYF